MDRSPWIDLRSWEGCRRLRFFKFSLVMLIVATSSSTALAQLRTGRSTRSVYRDQSSVPRKVVAKPGSGQTARARQKDSDAVRTASYSQETVSIVDDPVQDSVPDRVIHTEVAQASCHGCDGGCDSCGPVSHAHGGFFTDVFAPRAYAMGCGASGCDGITCDACCGGNSSLIPTCSMACPPGCGPLLALWYRLSVRAEVPLYWRRDQGPPILATTATAGTPADVAGQIGDPNTSVLLGGTLSDDATVGARITLGTWFRNDKRLGIHFRYWNAGKQSLTSTFESGTTPIIARPFLNTTGTPEQDTQLIAFPGQSVGDLRVTATSELDGLEVSLRRLVYMDRFTRVDVLYGYQRVLIDEQLEIATNTLVTGNVPGLQGTSIAVLDQFNTRNEFNGVSYGIMSSRRFARFKAEAMFRLGLGNLRRSVAIGGTTTTTSGGASSTEAQGLFARNTNNQAVQHDTFVVVPEVGINFAYCISSGLDLNIGYNYMLIPKVAQAARQLDDNLAVNLSDPLVGALDPSLDFEERDYWVNSLGLGLQLRY